MTVNPFPLQLKLLRKATPLSGPRGPIRLLDDAQHQEIRGMMTDSRGRMALDGLNSGAGRESLDRLATVHGNVRALVRRGMLVPIQTTHTQHLDARGGLINPPSVTNQSTIAKIHQTDGFGSSIAPQLADKGVTFAGLVSTGGPIYPRPFVMVRHVEPNGTVHHLPFYNSTGQAEKEETQTGEWYYTPGIQHLDNTGNNHGWIGKIGGKDMIETSQIPIIKYYKSILDAHLGDLTGKDPSNPNKSIDSATVPMMFNGIQEKTNAPNRLADGTVMPYSFKNIIDPTGQDPRRLGHTFAAISRLTSTAPEVKSSGGISELLRDLKVNGITNENWALWQAQKKHLGTLTPPKA